MPLFEGCDPTALAPVARELERRSFDPNADLMREGEEGRFFAILLSGQVTVMREGPSGAERLALAGAGSVIGELALLRGRTRGATVTATTPTVALIGDLNAFELLLDLPGVNERIRPLVSARLAEDVRPVSATSLDGTPVLLRPLMPSDRPGIAEALRQMSRESLRRRFFTAGRPSDSVVDYLVDLDYVDHFAWLTLDGRAPVRGFATARYIRRPDAPERAEITFAVTDSYQGRGIGSLLLGAVGAAASMTGIERFTASLLADNAPCERCWPKLTRRSGSGSRGSPRRTWLWTTRWRSSREISSASSRRRPATS